MSERNWIRFGLALLSLSAGAAQAAVRVEAFSPAGTVKGVRQVTASFTAPVVRFGDPRLPDPFQIDCPAPGRARWADPRHWVYDFEADLPAGVRCRFTLKSGLKAASGDAVADSRAFGFDTGGPAVLASLPRDGSQSLDEHQQFLLKLDAPADAGTVRANSFCAVTGIAEKIPVEVLEGEPRKALLAQREKLGYEYYRLLWASGTQTVAQVQNRKLAEAEEGRIIALQCARALPPNSQVQLVWGAGIRTLSGIATTQDQQLAFKTRPAFTASLSCERVNATAGCLPFLPLQLGFSAPVPRKLAAAVRLRIGGRSYEPVIAEAETVSIVEFKGSFPEHSAARLELPAGLVDDAGRKLENAARFPLEVAIDAAPPLAKFSGEFGILEAREGGVLPVSLRSVEAALAAGATIIPAAGIAGQSRSVDDDAEILRWMRRVAVAMKSESADVDYTPDPPGQNSVFTASDQPRAFTVPAPTPGKGLEVVGIPLETPGFHVVELSSPLLGAALLGPGRTRYVATTALVTNMAVHLKTGRESSLVFVSTLDGARPVAAAAIRVSDACDGRELWTGRTDGSGLARIAEALPPSGESCRWGPHPLMVSARHEGDLSFVLSNWNRGITPDSFHLPVYSWLGQNPDIAHTVLDRMLFRAGETVSMKHLLRRHGSAGLSVPSERPTRLLITHEGSGQRFELPLDWQASGTAESRWPIPKEAKLGSYRLTMTTADDRYTLDSGEFRVEQYRVPALRGIIHPPKAALVNPKEVPLDLFVSYFSGGGAGNLPVRLRTQLLPKALSFPDYESYQFGGTEVREGIASGNGYGAFWSEDSTDAEDATDTAAPGSSARLLPLLLDAQGAARTAVRELPKLAQASELVTELEYQDANGETLTTGARIPLWPAGLVLGIQPEGWVATKDDLRFKVVALGLDGKPLAGRSLRVEGFTQTVHSYRRRLVGGFYAYEHSTETRSIGSLCSGRTDAQGLLSCRTTVERSGEILLQATANDEQGNRALARSSLWVSGGEDWWFEAGPNDRMDLIPERPAYEHGETARFQVRMPFREATALVTVEREGVIDSQVVHLSGKDPIVEVPIKDGYSPNVYVSVLALRGRVGVWRSRLADLVRWLHLPFTIDGGSPGALVDLSKPAYRLGIANIRVGWDPHRLEVRVTPAADTYRTRETARVTVSVKPALGGALPAGAEIALAAVDEGLLALMPNESWKLLDAMMGLRGLEVGTATAQMQVIGKRHYGRKAGAPGGSGGRAPARELFDTLLLWKGRVPLDANGQAMVDVPLNDALSSFRIVAIATAGSDRFGTGSASIRTTQDLQLVSGLPSLVREGDRLEATVTLRNASTRAITADLSARFAAGTPAVTSTLPPQQLKLEAGAAAEARWSITVPANAGALAWEIRAQELKGPASDLLKLSVPALPAYPVRVYQATLAQVDGRYELPVAQPADALPGRGGVRVELSAKLGSLEGVRDWLRSYPWSCLEQQASKAIGLGDDAAWAATMQRLPSYLDRDGLPRYFPSERLDGSDTLAAYLLSIAASAGREIPEASLTRMLDGLEGFVAGRVVRDSALPTADLAARKLAAIAALAAHGRAQPPMLSTFTIEPNLWPTSALLDWIAVLQRMKDVPEQARRLDEATQILRARMNFQGTLLGFSTERDDALWWLMASTDANAARALLQLLPMPGWNEDLPRLARGLLGRQRDAHWDTTVANAWGSVAMQAFSQRYEAAPVSGSTRAQLGTQLLIVDWQKPAAPVEFAWPAPSEPAAGLSLEHAGSGKPWAVISARAAIPLKTPLFTGYSIKRTVTPVQQQQAGRWLRGDVARVRLELDAQSDMGWVVVEDPIPSGASIQGSGLGGSSELLSRGEQRDGVAWLAFEERRSEALRAYYRFVPKGRWSLEYTLRYNAAGHFELPATRVEAMYAPEMFGELPNAPVEVITP